MAKKTDNLPTQAPVLVEEPLQSWKVASPLHYNQQAYMPESTVLMPYSIAKNLFGGALYQPDEATIQANEQALLQTAQQNPTQAQETGGSGSEEIQS